MGRLRALLILISASTFLLAGCKKEGCTDVNATNYDLQADRDDGSCLYDTTTVLSDNLRINFLPRVGPQALTLGSFNTDVKGQLIRLETFRFYLSQFKLMKSDSQFVDVSDVELIDFSSTASSSFTAMVEGGDYIGLVFGIGVDSALNETDPNSYATGHPLHIFSGTYWDWNTQYRFVMMEGKVDTTGNGDQFDHSFVYHTGTNDLYRTAALIADTFSLSAKGLQDINLVVDLNKILYQPNDTIDVITEDNTHTTDNLPLAVKFTDNFAASFAD